MIDIGFIGLGIMGRPMAGHLQAAGHRLFLHDVVPIAPELVAAGGVVCKSGKEVAEQADVVIIMVPDTPHVEAVLFGKDGVAAGLSKGQDRRRHELDLAARHQGIRQEDRGARLPTISMRRSPAARSAPRRRASPSWSADRSARSTP